MSREHLPPGSTAGTGLTAALVIPARADAVPGTFGHRARDGERPFGFTEQ